MQHAKQFPDAAPAPLGVLLLRVLVEEGVQNGLHDFLFELRERLGAVLEPALLRSDERSGRGGARGFIGFVALFVGGLLARGLFGFRFFALLGGEELLVSNANVARLLERPSREAPRDESFSVVVVVHHNFLFGVQDVSVAQIAHELWVLAWQPPTQFEKVEHQIAWRGIPCRILFVVVVIFVGLLPAGGPFRCHFAGAVDAPDVAVCAVGCGD